MESEMEPMETDVQSGESGESGESSRVAEAGTPPVKDKKAAKEEKARLKTEEKIAKKASKKSLKVEEKIEKKKRDALDEEGNFANRDTTKGVDPELYAEYHRQKSNLKVQGYAHKKEAKVNKKYGGDEAEPMDVCGERGGDVKCIDPDLVAAYHKQKADYKVELKRAKADEKVQKKKLKYDEKAQKKDEKMQKKAAKEGGKEGDREAPTDGTAATGSLAAMEVDFERKKAELKAAEYAAKKEAEIAEYSAKKERKVEKKVAKVRPEVAPAEGEAPVPVSSE